MYDCNRIYIYIYEPVGPPLGRTHYIYAIAYIYIYMSLGCAIAGKSKGRPSMRVQDGAEGIVLIERDVYICTFICVYICMITIAGRPKGRPCKRPQDGGEGDSPDAERSAYICIYTHINIYAFVCIYMCTTTIAGRPKGRPRKHLQDGEEGDSPDGDASATDPLNALVCARESGQGRERVCARVRKSRSAGE